mgnify:CR=1 FL=1
MCCDKLLATLPNVRWAEPVFGITSQLLETSIKFIANNFCGVLSSDRYVICICLYFVCLCIYIFQNSVNCLDIYNIIICGSRFNFWLRFFLLFFLSCKMNIRTFRLHLSPNTIWSSQSSKIISHLSLDWQWSLTSDAVHNLYSYIVLFLFL